MIEKVNVNVYRYRFASMHSHFYCVYIYTPFPLFYLVEKMYTPRKRLATIYESDEIIVEQMEKVVAQTSEQ